MTRLANGTLLGSPVWAGFGEPKPQCRPAEHRWADLPGTATVITAETLAGEPELRGELLGGEIRLQSCEVCGWQRAKVTPGNLAAFAPREGP